MISGAHMIIYSTDSEADRAFFRDVLNFPFVDVGHGWLIFALPPSEIAVHPAPENNRHEVYLMCDDVDATVLTLQARKIACEPVNDVGWGRLTHLTLPGGGKLGLYQPRHPLAPRNVA
jgi:predicted enzyme related to lactoylglutathione lyase